MSTHPCAPQSTAHSAVIKISSRRCLLALPVLGSLIPVKHAAKCSILSPKRRCPTPFGTIDSVAPRNAFCPRSVKIFQMRLPCVASPLTPRRKEAIVINRAGNSHKAVHRHGLCARRFLYARTLSGISPHGGCPGIGNDRASPYGSSNTRRQGWSGSLPDGAY